jgi:protein SCO1/2
MEKRLFAVVIGIFIVGAALIAALALLRPPSAGEAPKSKMVATPSPIGGSFEMINQEGDVVTQADFADDYKMMFFGFTNCPGICPGELQKMAAVLEALGPQAPKIQPLFISIDPDRDTPDVLKEYVELFHPRIVGLTGSREQVEDIKKNFKIYASKVEMEHMGKDNYMMDHSTFTYFFSPEGELLLVFDMQDTADQIASEIRTVL